jgi:hypothetical protein
MQNGFRPWIRALGRIIWWKNRGSKSYDTVPLIIDTRSRSGSSSSAFFYG